jgi:hypothetical protein
MRSRSPVKLGFPRNGSSKNKQEVREAVEITNHLGIDASQLNDHAVDSPTSHSA